jgi:hypothetical protein
MASETPPLPERSITTARNLRAGGYIGSTDANGLYSTHLVESVADAPMGHSFPEIHVRVAGCTQLLRFGVNEEITVFDGPVSERETWEELVLTPEARDFVQFPLNNETEREDRGQDVDAGMLEKVTEDKQSGTRECFGWTCGEWAVFLHCSEPNVVSAPTWAMLRKLQQVEFGEDQ